MLNKVYNVKLLSESARHSFKGPYYILKFRNTKLHLLLVYLGDWANIFTKTLSPKKHVPYRNIIDQHINVS